MDVGLFDYMFICPLSEQNDFADSGRFRVIGENSQSSELRIGTLAEYGRRVFEAAKIDCEVKGAV